MRPHWTWIAGTLLLIALLPSCDGATPPGVTGPPSGARACSACSCDFPIASVPFQITTPGRYCFSNDLKMTAAGTAIDVQADSVSIDFAGRRLEGTGTGVGIYSYERNTVTIRNGTVRGFERGIYLIGVGSRQHVVEDMRVVGNTYAGIQVFGDQSIVRRCFVTDTGGASSNPKYAFGINIAGNGAQVIDNFVHHTFATATGGGAAGIQSDQADAFLFDNRVMNVSGGDRNNGIFCNGGGVVPLLRGNAVVGAATPYGGGCTAVGTSNYP